MLRVFFVLLASLAAPAAERLLEFSKMKAGEPPVGLRSSLMGGGPPGDWKIIEAEVPPVLAPVTGKAEIPVQPVLAQVSRDPTANRYPLLILDEDFANFTLHTRFKLHAGVVEQMAGIAFRMQNESNYFYIRASGLYNSLRFVPVVNGQILSPVGPDLEIEKGVWHELKIEASGNQFNCWLNGKQAFPTLNDNTFSAGKIAFWTKSDSVSYFADTRIVYTPREPLAAALVRDGKEKNSRIQSLRISARKPDGAILIIASDNPGEIGQPANKIESEVLTTDKKFVGRDKQRKVMIATLPLHDKNGEVAASVRFEIDPFPGQTEKNLLERTVPIVREMESRLAAYRELTGLQ